MCFMNAKTFLKVDFPTQRQKILPIRYLIYPLSSILKHVETVLISSTKFVNDPVNCTPGKALYLHKYLKQICVLMWLNLAPLYTFPFVKPQ